MEKRTIERYSKGGVIFHWTFSFIVVILVLTGIIMFVPGRNEGGSYIAGIIHKVSAAGFLAIPVLYSLFSPGSVAGFLKETFSWGKEDLKWFMAAPNYYFGGMAENMPHQDRLNTGQKMWQLVLVLTAVVFLITGAVMGFFRSAIAINIYEWLLFIHGAAFVVFLLMLLVHLYMSILHPRMRGAFYSMIDGKVSESYARGHHRKWYERIEGQKTKGTEKPGN